MTDNTDFRGKAKELWSHLTQDLAFDDSKCIEAISRAFAAALEARDAKITDLKAQIRLKDDAISDLQARDDFLMKVLGMPADELKELQQLIEERKKA